MLNNLLSRFSRRSNKEIISVESADLVARLEYQGLLIGELTRSGHIWTFRYSPDFQQQTAISPITDFPDKSKTYTSGVLWPFFALRIPSLNQYRVKTFLEEKKPNDPQAALLKEFGRFSTANPFELQSA
jgi:HipA-like protein